MNAITILFHQPKLGYVTFYDGGTKVEVGDGYPINKHPVWDATHFSIKERTVFMKDVCNGRGCVEDLTRLQGFLVAWGCKKI